MKIGNDSSPSATLFTIWMLDGESPLQAEPWWTGKHLWRLMHSATEKLVWNLWETECLASSPLPRRETLTTSSCKPPFVCDCTYQPYLMQSIKGAAYWCCLLVVDRGVDMNVIPRTRSAHAQWGPANQTYTVQHNMCDLVLTLQRLIEIKETTRRTVVDVDTLYWSRVGRRHVQHVSFVLEGPKHAPPTRHLVAQWNTICDKHKLMDWKYS